MEQQPIIGASYRLREPLGRGASAEVFLAEHVVLGHRVVIKILHPRLDASLADRLRLEGQALARVRHDNVVTVFDCGTTDDGRPYLVMEHLDGEPLDQYLARRGAELSVDEALDVARQTLAGLHAIHEAGFVHRDIKPHNLFRGVDGRIKLLDLGVTKLLQRLTDVAPLAMPTSEGAVVGTPKYMAPEQALEGEVDRRADIYAVGMLLYKMLTGATPFDHHHNLADLLAAQAFEKPRPPSSLAPQRVTPKLDAVILRALAKQPQARYPDALSMAADLVVLDRSYEMLATELGIDDSDVDSTVVMSEPVVFDLGAPEAASPPQPAPQLQAIPVGSSVDSTVLDPGLSAALAVSLQEPVAPPVRQDQDEEEEEPSVWRDPLAQALFVAAALVSALLTVAVGMTVGVG